MQVKASSTGEPTYLLTDPTEEPGWVVEEDNADEVVIAIPSMTCA
jgi:hypothetical protein